MNDLRRHPVLLAVSAALVLSGLVHLGVLALDDRPWSGPLSWRKPATFGLSFGVTLATVVAVSSTLRMSARVRQVLLVVLAVDCVVEVTGVTVQAWRHHASHLNTTTPSDTVVAASLAAGGAVLIVVLGWLAVVALRGRVEGPPDLVLAVRAGFALLLVGLASGAAMIARGSAVRSTEGAEQAYQAVGFLKNLHGVTLHAVLVLPALAWLLARAGVAERTRWRAVAGAVAAYLLAALVLLVGDLAAL